MHTLPPGFGRLPFGNHSQHFLLPNAVIKQLTQPVKPEAEDELEDSEFSLLGPLGSAKPIPFTFSFACREEGVLYPKIFDVAAIQKRKKDSSTHRNQHAVMKRFEENDDGLRELKKVPEHFFAEIRRLKVKYPNCVNFLDYVGSFAALSLKQAYPGWYFPPVLLFGPPGVGKTAVLGELAGKVGVPCRQVDLASTTAGMVLAGSSTQWSDAKTGVIVDLLRDGHAANPIIILDEIDKAAQEAKFNPLGPLYSLLEQHTAAKFIDEALDLPVDASHVLYVATANSLESIPKAILSRFTVIEIHPVAAEQHTQVTQSIYESLLQKQGCVGLFAKKLSTGVIEALREHSPRVIKNVLRLALAKAAERSRNGKKLMVIKDDLLFSSVAESQASHYSRKHPIGFMP